MRLTLTLFLLGVLLSSCANLQPSLVPTPSLPQLETPTAMATATYAGVPTLTTTPTATPLPSFAASQIIQKRYAIIQTDNTDYIHQLVRYHRFELEDDYWGQGHHTPDNIMAPDNMMGVVFSPNGYMLLFGSSNGAGLWNIEKYLTQPWLEESRPVNITQNFTRNVGFSPDGQFIAADNLFGHPLIQIFEVNTLNIIAPELRLNPVYDFSFSRDGNTMAVLADRLYIWNWHGTNGYPERQIDLPSEYIPLQFDRYDNTSVAFSPDGTLIATGGIFSKSKQPGIYKNVIVLWDFNTGKVVNILGKDNDMGRIYSLSFNSEGNFLVSGSGRNNSADTVYNKTSHNLLTSSMEGGKVRVWDIKDGTLLTTLEGDEYITHTVAFSPDGNIFAAGNQDGTIKLWDTKTYMLLRTIQAHLVKTTEISFSFDGRFIASSGNDGTVGVWGVCAHYETEYPADNASQQEFRHPCISY